MNASLLLLSLALLSCVALEALATSRASVAQLAVEKPLDTASITTSLDKRKPPKKFHFKSPKGLFIQERASKQLPGPGQHYSFGALKSWDEIHRILDDNPGSKLLLLVRHGEAVSNWLSDTLGPDEWFKVEETCSYTDDDDKTWGIFDADLTDTGISEAKVLNGMLDNLGWFKTLTGGRAATALVSPLSRCLQSSLLVLDGLPLERVEVEENLRETLGEDTCDARRSVSSPSPKHPHRLEGPCSFQDGLQDYYPQFEYPIVDEYAREQLRSGNLTKHHHHHKDKGSDKQRGLGFGMLGDRDAMWTPKREGQKHQVKRAANFLFDVFEFVEERVVVVVTHSGTVRSLLLALGREPYRPQNTELVPVIVEPIKKSVEDDEDEDSEAWTYSLVV